MARLWPAYQSAMFVFSKFALFFVDPGVWSLILLGLGAALLWTRWRRAGRLLVSATFLLLLAIAVLPIGEGMVAVLEDRFPPVRALEPPVDGIIVLGGAVQQLATRRSGQPALNEHAERMTEAISLARRFPAAKIVFTGGSSAVFNQADKETEVARLFFTEMGLDPDRPIYESRSRNTYESAVNTYALLKPQPGQRWVVVTSAMHMPRTIGVFRKAGWDPVPYPVDYRTLGVHGLTTIFNLRIGLNTLRFALHEWLGLIAYRALGRTDSLFPAPARG